MSEAALIHAVIVLLFAVLLWLPEDRRPAASIAAAFLLFLLNPARDTDGNRVAGPFTGLAVVIFLAIGLVMIGGWRHPQNS